MVLIVLGFIADFYIKKEKKEHLDKMETLINNNEKIAWKNFFEIDMTDLIKAEQLIKLGIGKRLFYGEIEKKVSQPFMEILKNETLLFIDELAVNQNFSDYSIVDVKRSTVDELSIGTYFYKFDDLGNLLLLKAPFRFTDEYPIFDYEFIQSTFFISIDEIKDFQYFGTQLMENKINTVTQAPSMGVIFSEVFLGPSYSILKGISKISLSSSHSINDARVVQLVLKDQTDIEFGGITIFYDFNRKFGNVKNKEIIDRALNYPLKLEEKQFEKGSIRYIEELKELKLLQESDIITQEEFEERKKIILDNPKDFTPILNDKTS